MKQSKCWLLFSVIATSPFPPQSHVVVGFSYMLPSRHSVFSRRHQQLFAITGTTVIGNEQQYTYSNQRPHYNKSNSKTKTRKPKEKRRKASPRLVRSVSQAIGRAQASSSVTDYEQRILEQCSSLLQCIEYSTRNQQSSSPSRSFLATSIESILVEEKDRASISIPMQHIMIQTATLSPGLLPLALRLTHQNMKELFLHTSSTTTVSATTQAALAESLRFAKDGQHSFKELMDEFSKTGIIPSMVLFNNYLSSSLAGVNSNKRAPSMEQIQNGLCLLRSAPEKFSLQADLYSFNTLLHAASKMKNSTLSEEIWNHVFVEQPTIVPNIVSYNARLRTLAGDPTAVLALWDDEICNRHRDAATPPEQLVPDQYTLDLLLLPMLVHEDDREEEFLELLDSFVARVPAGTASNALSAWMITLVNNHDHHGIEMACSLWKACVPRPLENNSRDSSTGASTTMIEPQTRHYNILLEGYKAAYIGCTGGVSSADTDTQAEILEKAWQLYGELVHHRPGVRPDSYTLSTMCYMCRNSTELSDLLYSMIEEFQVKCNEAVLRTAIRLYGSLGDPSSALWLFSMYSPKSISTWNMVVTCLADAVILNSIQQIASPEESHLARLFLRSNSTARTHQPSRSSPAQWLLLFDREWPVNVFHLIRSLLHLLGEPSKRTAFYHPRPNSQTFGAAARGLQACRTTDATVAAELFANATALGVAADGRFLNAVLRCCGNNLAAALALWKATLRSPCVAHAERSAGMREQNLRAAYTGLLYVSGRAFRPDVALRLIYALEKDGIEPEEGCLNAYMAGRRDEDRQPSPLREGLMAVHESVLFVECAKFDQKDRRRQGEKRVRIILPQ